jgi:hypothetical protein
MGTCTMWRIGSARTVEEHDNLTQGEAMNHNRSHTTTEHAMTTSVLRRLGYTLAVTLGLITVAAGPAAAVLGVGVASLPLAAPASATQPQPQQFETIGHLTGPSTVAGTWTSTGVLNAAGTYTETFRFEGSTIHGVKVLTSVDGTIVLDTRALVVWLDECTATLRAGHWQIADASGAYAGLKGGGSPNSTPESFGNVCTGSVDVIHSGAATSD